MNDRHFTAWMVNDPSCLDQACMDITILEDMVTGYRDDTDGTESPIWSSDSTKETAFYAVTTVDAKEGDASDGIKESEELMLAAGWRTVGEWDALDNSYVVTVERVAQS